MRSRSLDMIELLSEARFLEKMQLGCIIVIRQLWTDEALSVERVVLSDWVWREEMRSDERIGRLIDAGLVAGVQRDEELASAIASTGVGMVHRVRSGSETVDILQALLGAGTAFQHEDAWAEWLERQLANMATSTSG